MRKLPIVHIVIYITAFVFILSCAKQVAITGGPKDTTPPVVVKAIPENGSTNFVENIIYVQFDEFIKLNSLNQKLIVSPPISETPKVVVKGKGIKISINTKELQANTTYSLNFNDAIADNNENNALNSFVYAFSTGDLIDSLSFSGKVIDAFSKKPVTDAWVILHDNLSDSAVSKIQPAYITKVDKDGKFLIPFVKENEYRLYAIKDNNSNFLYDMPDEQIAFIDSIFIPGVEKLVSPDSLMRGFVNYPENVELLLFKENNQSQFIKSSKRTYNNYLELIFNSTQYEDYSISIDGENNPILIAKTNPDTVSIWLRDTSLINSQNFSLYCSFIDPVFTDTLQLDTILIKASEKRTTLNECKLSLNSIKEPHKDMFILSSTPISEIDLEKISMKLKTEDGFVKTNLEIFIDSLNPLLLKLESEFLEKSEYQIIVENGFATNIYSQTNELDTLSFSTTSTSEYGQLKIDMSKMTSPLIVQLISGEKVIAESFSVDGIVDFSFIKPGTYKLRVIEDLNNNRRWDTGNFKTNLQAEPVYFYPSEYEIRSNWLHEVEWNPTTNVSE